MFCDDDDDDDDDDKLLVAVNAFVDVITAKSSQSQHSCHLQDHCSKDQ